MKKRMGLLLLFLFAACDREMPLQKPAAIAPPQKPRAPVVSYYEGTHAAEAIQQIRAKVGEPFRVMRVSIDDDVVWVRAQDPKKRENVDEYRITRGVMRDPVPVRLFGVTDQETLEANLFDPADVDWTKIPDLVREANEKIQLEGREMSGVSVVRDMFDEHRPIQIDVDYSGTRKHGYLRTDRHGAHSTVRVF
jgi:hypothetical protein